jgi:hypothetical protein
MDEKRDEGPGKKGNEGKQGGVMYDATFGQSTLASYICRQRAEIEMTCRLQSPSRAY